MTVSFKCKVSILFFPVILFIEMQVSGQEAVDLKRDDFIFRYKKNTKITEAVYKYGESFLAPRFYKTKEKDIVSSFEVGDSGKLVGSFKIYINQTLSREQLWNDGILVREYILMNNKVRQELFDSSVSIMQYDSSKNTWKNFKKVVHVEKDFPSGKNETRINFMNGGSNSYALYYFKSDKLVREIIPHYYDKRFDTAGNIQFFKQYNWKLKQIETITFKGEKILSNEILKNKNIIWNKKGFVTDPDNEEIGKESVTNYFYPNGIIKQKITIKNYYCPR